MQLVVFSRKCLRTTRTLPTHLPWQASWQLTRGILLQFKRRTVTVTVSTEEAISFKCVQHVVIECEDDLLVDSGKPSFLLISKMAADLNFDDL